MLFVLTRAEGWGSTLRARWRSNSSKRFAIKTPAFASSGKYT
jgi:hypothetical protein